MNNTKIEVVGDNLVITVGIGQQDEHNAPLSKTGKTRLLASTGGAQPVECNIPGLKVALNVMIPTN